MKSLWARIKARWKGFCARIPRLPRRWRLVRNLVCILLLCGAVWLLRGGKPLSVTDAFRRAEKGQMVGPSEVVFREQEHQTSYRTTTIVGETETGYLVCHVDKHGFLNGYGTDTAFQKRRDGVTLLVLSPYNGRASEELDLMMACDEPEAERLVGEFTFAATGSLNGKRYDFNETYTVEFLPVGNGLFRGMLTMKQKDEPDGDDELWEYLLEQSRLGDLYNGTTPVTVKVYGPGDTLLAEESFDYYYPGRY